MIPLLLVLLGLCFGSFINALVWRLHEGRDWVRERSECPHCHRTLAAKDLIPVISWLLLGGKCRYCRKPIPDSPVVELAVPALFLLSYYLWPAPLTGQALFEFCLWLVFLVGFTVLAVYDLKWFLLPDVIVFPLIGLALVQVGVSAAVFSGSVHSLVGPLLGILVVSGTFAALYYLSKGAWIGFGDVKLGIVLGLLAGGAIPGLLLLLTASLTGTLIALPLVLQGKAGRGTHLPFGPLLIFGLVVVKLFGESIIGWYTGLAGI